jgi:hypothetical protein
MDDAKVERIMENVAQGLGRVLIAALFAASIGNLAVFNLEFRHWPFFSETTLSQRIVAAEPVRTTFTRLGIDRAGYFTEDLDSDEGLFRFFVLQYVSVPVVLRRDVGEEQYVLIDNWQTGALPETPGWTLVEDFGNGLALYRR